MSTAIITGASSGLGRAYVDAVLKIFPEIDELWLIARRTDRLAEIADTYPQKKVIPIPMDLADMKNYQLFQEKLDTEKPEIKLLVNDAGVSSSGHFEEQNLEKMLGMIDLNVKGATAITRVCLPYILNGGTILEVSSTSAFVPNVNLVVYCATKAYVSAMCTGLREELKSRNINVCAMCPGLMLTEMPGKLTVQQQKLPKVDVKKAAVKSLKAAKKGRSVYTTGAFYKGYRLLAKLMPANLMVKFAGLG